ncbi:hypothetical protein BCV69DRAFT_22758 [Microstroma glucosiphilum]|uniref:Uncharacterized protein n=1 Tax=Pseudomicrostroma glucosiphilum TaxID=1684307 RepID=A0A316UG60_9BASI|nr:hypothetical protein BCV69DRAFT_22758 [Pseudomicrostroma glucosiphilum]PWN24190.1 hypothetical protein BCV69DRAFT_22758 [Pseudomicrostroma glucosiphilum]
MVLSTHPQMYGLYLILDQEVRIGKETTGCGVDFFAFAYAPLFFFFVFFARSHRPRGAAFQLRPSSMRAPRLVAASGQGTQPPSSPDCWTIDRPFPQHRRLLLYHPPLRQGQTHRRGRRRSPPPPKTQRGGARLVFQSNNHYSPTTGTAAPRPLLQSIPLASHAYLVLPHTNAHPSSSLPCRLRRFLGG